MAKTGGKGKLVNNCPYAGECGGCAYTGCGYIEQALAKQKMIKDLLPSSCEVKPIITCDKPFHYRNKVHSAYKRLKNGRIVCGPYARGSHHIIGVKDCLLENETAGAIIRDCASIAGRLKVRIYSEASGQGELRKVLVKVAEATGEVMVVLVIGHKYFTRKSMFIKELLKAHPEITTILTSVHDGHNSMILGDTVRREYGPGYITDELLGKRFRISASSFYQVNRRQAELLYSTAIRMAELTPSDSVLDCYCGTGTISICMAPFAGHVTGIELNPDAVKDAVKNARTNKITNVEFVCEDATKYMEELTASGGKCDVVVLDPTRLGTTPGFINACSKLAPSRIIYVSCGPDTLARDIKLFAYAGYVAKSAEPCDMFPWAESCECVCVLEKK